MHHPALVDVAVHVVRAHLDVTQLKQVEQHAVVFVDRRRARVHGHLGGGSDGRDRIGRQHVRGEEVVEGAERVRDGHPASRRAGPLDPAHQRHDVGLVDRHPAPAVRRQRGHHPGDVAGEDVGRARPEPELRTEPPRMGEVVQGDDGLHAPRRAEREDLRVALQCAGVESPGLRLEPRPLDGEPERVAADGGGAVQRLFGVTPEVAGQTRAGGPAGALPRGPVVLGLAVPVEAALDLVARRRHPDGEAVAEQARGLGGPGAWPRPRRRRLARRRGGRHPFSLSGARGPVPPRRRAQCGGATERMRESAAETMSTSSRAWRTRERTWGSVASLPAWTAAACTSRAASITSAT